MSSQRARLRVASIVLLGLAFIGGCSTDRKGNFAGNLLGITGFGNVAENGLTLTADPPTIVIDPDDPTTPTDPNHGNEHYGETALLVVATDPDGNPQVDLDVTFTASAGTLASGGVTVKTDAQGRANDVLRVFESDPGTIQVSVADSARSTTITVTKVVSQAPVADAGSDLVVECTGDSSAQVTLNGSGSTDPNNDITLYEWFEHFGTPEEVLLDKGVTADVVLALGEHVITLRVTDATGKTSTDEVAVEVVDTKPPVVSISVTPSSLWPPNHKMIHVVATLQVQECGEYTVSLESIQSNEPGDGRGDGHTSDDILGAATGTADYEFDLRAERSGRGNGRVYTITYRVVDAGGLETRAKAFVRVGHDRGNSLQALSRSGLPRGLRPQ